MRFFDAHCDAAMHIEDGDHDFVAEEFKLLVRRRDSLHRVRAAQIGAFIAYFCGDAIVEFEVTGSIHARVHHRVLVQGVAAHCARAQPRLGRHALVGHGLRRSGGDGGWRGDEERLGDGLQEGRMGI